MKTAFYKYHGLGNDFVLIDRGTQGLPDEPEKWAEWLCRRRFGVGADGVLFLLSAKSEEHHAAMRIFNADGSEAEMCGNGLRCLAKHLMDHHEMEGEIWVETAAGPRFCVVGKGEKGQPQSSVSVDMGKPRWKRQEIPMYGEGECIRSSLPGVEAPLMFTAVSMGNPHLIAFLDGETSGSVMDWALKEGPGLENHEWFPQKTNVSFVRRVGDHRWKAAVWERGVGLTAACGTGACAIGTAACLEERASKGRPQEIQLPGGVLTVTVRADWGAVQMEGSADFVFKGEASVDSIPQRVRLGIPENHR